ncbi:MAG: hypothetical protein A2046_04145 [Bacteroidetes bacterium GWA2_30_7]|nr:MAG: hypothetical protein A2046_04145 [Bacteroidetes bacterium GWA2_30_7]
MDLFIIILNIIGFGLIGASGLMTKKWKWKLFFVGFILMASSTIYVNDKNSKLNSDNKAKQDTIIQLICRFDSIFQKLNAVTLDKFEIKNVITERQIKETKNLQVINITDSLKVGWRQVIKGKIVDISKKVYVIVHPMSIQGYWVQPNTTISSDGTWNCNAYIGRNTQDIGIEYEIMAIANPKIVLNEGDVLNSWPEAEWHSNVVTVIRK